MPRIMAAAAPFPVFALQGATSRFSVRLFDGLGPVSSAIDLTGKTISARIAYSDDEDADPAPTQWVVDAATNGAKGVVTFTLPRTHQNAPGEWYYRIDLVDGAIEEPVLYGTLTIGESN